MIHRVGINFKFGYILANTKQYAVVFITARTQEEAIEAREELAKSDLFLTPALEGKEITPLLQSKDGPEVGNKTTNPPYAYQFSFGVDPMLTERELNDKLKKNLGRKLRIEA